MTSREPRLGREWDDNIAVKCGEAWLLRNHGSAGGVDLSIGYNLGFAAPGAISRDRVGKGSQRPCRAAS